MDITPLVKEGAQVVQSYAGGQFRVSGVVYETPLIVQSNEVLIWDVQGSDVLCEADFDVLVERATDIDVVLLGTGARQKFLPLVLRNALRDKGLSIDVMDTGAACRTYNVLMADGRRVVCALIPV